MILLQPNRQELARYFEISKQYGMGFEVLDFAFAALLDHDSKAETLRKEYEGMTLVSSHGIFADLNYSGSDPLIYKESAYRIKQCMEAVSMLDIHKIIFHSCFHPVLHPADPLYGVWSRQFADLFCPLAEKYDMQIYIENVLDRTPDILAQMMREANHPNIHVCLDVGHANLTGCSMKEWIEVLHPYLEYLHLNDNRGNYDEHMVIGEGSIDWEELGGLLKEKQIKADYTLEVPGAEQAVQSLQYLRQCWGEDFDHAE